MQIKTLLNRVQKHSSFVYETVRLVEPPRLAIEGEVRPRELLMMDLSMHETSSRRSRPRSGARRHVQPFGPSGGAERPIQRGQGELHSHRPFEVPGIWRRVHLPVPPRGVGPHESQ